MTEAVDILFKEFIDGGLPYIKSLKQNAISESHILEFKQLKNSIPPLTDGDKQNLAKTISAFANSDGGVLVWGIEAKGNPEVVSEFKPISKLADAKNLIRSLVNQLIQPYVKEIQIESILDTNDTGYVVMMIPSVTEGDPIMAMAKDQRQYYIRVGTQSLAAEHNQISMFFRRRALPKLEVSWDVIISHDTAGRRIVRVRLGIANSGRGIAKFAAATFHPSSTFDTNDLGMAFLNTAQIPFLDTSAGIRPQGKQSSKMFPAPGDVIRTGTSVTVAEVWSYSGPKSMEIPYELHCEGIHEKGTLLISANDIRDKITTH